MGIQSTQLIQCHAGQMGHGLQKMTPPLLQLMSMEFDVTVLQEIGGHVDMQKPEASEWTKAWLQAALGDMTITHHVHITGPYVAMVRKASRDFENSEVDSDFFGKSTASALPHPESLGRLAE